MTTTHPTRRSLILGSLAAGTVGVGTIALAGPASALAGTDPVNDYPYRSSGIDQVDRWNFYTRECTSFAAWRLNSRNNIAFTNSWRGIHWGDASNWINAAGSAGLTVNRNPAVGAVAVPDGHGHVAWVNRLRSDGTISLEEYNWSPAYAYNHRIVSPGTFRYIHFPIN
jgi:surface antigen